MDREREIRELKEQQALIRRHLDWLEHRLARLEDPPNATSLRENPPATAIGPSGSLPPDPPPATPATPAPPVPPSPASPESTPAEEVYLRPESGDLDSRARVGCIALLILSLAIFLFLLFGLPYLIY